MFLGLKTFVMLLLDLEATLFLSIRVLVLECESSMGPTTIAALITLFAIAYIMLGSSDTTCRTPTRAITS
mgnify:FL=1